MKYKKGDKFIIEVEGVREYPMYMICQGQLMYESTLDLLEPYDESAAYQRGLNDAWEAARKILLLKVSDVGNVFDVPHWSDVFKNYTAEEALERIRAYEASQEIHVGDEVTIKPNNKKGVVLECHVPDICNEDKYSVLCGNMTEFVVKRWITKTGRHFPEVAALLDKLKGDATDV